MAASRWNCYRAVASFRRKWLQSGYKVRVMFDSSLASWTIKLSGSTSSGSRRTRAWPECCVRIACSLLQRQHWRGNVCWTNLAELRSQAFWLWGSAWFLRAGQAKDHMESPESHNEKSKSWANPRNRMNMFIRVHNRAFWCRRRFWGWRADFYPLKAWAVKIASRISWMLRSIPAWGPEVELKWNPIPSDARSWTAYWKAPRNFPGESL